MVRDDAVPQCCQKSADNVTFKQRPEGSKGATLAIWMNLPGRTSRRCCLASLRNSTGPVFKCSGNENGLTKLGKQFGSVLSELGSQWRTLSERATSLNSKVHCGERLEARKPVRK